MDSASHYIALLTVLAMAGVMLVFLITRSFVFIRTIHRQHLGLCVNCGYDLRGSRSGVCSECGRILAPPID